MKPISRATIFVWLSSLSQLKKWQLLLDIGYHWPTYEKDLLCTSQSHDRYTGSSKSDYRCGYASSRSFGVNYDRLELAFHIQILVFAVLLSRDQKKLSTPFHPQTNGQTEKQNSRIETYLRAFVNWEQDSLVKLLLIAEFAYSNTKNVSTSYTSFELNCDYHLRFFFKEDVDLCSRSCSANKLAEELRELIKVCCQNLLHVQKLQKRVYNIKVKRRSYAPGKKV